MFLGFPCCSVGKESACNAGELGSIPGLGRSPGEGKGYTLQYSGLENSMDSPWGHKESDTTERLSLHYLYFIHSVDEYLGCFHALVIVNSASVNIGVHVPFSGLVSSGILIIFFF